MQYRYRVIGKVEQSFILRGAYFAINSTIDFYVMESELAFVKEMCKLETIVDLQKATNAENSISNVAKPNTKSKEKAVKNEQSNRTSKRTNT